jgi:hypothetical protein
MGRCVLWIGDMPGDMYGWCDGYVDGCCVRVIWVHGGG